MDTPLRVEWLDGHREPTEPPDPRYPEGFDIDVSRGAAFSCATSLPYPAKRCGMFLVSCSLCGTRATITTAGRPDDPRSVRLPCQPVPASKRH